MSRKRAIARTAVKYGPHMVAAAKVARGPAEKAAREALERRKARRDAIAHAEGVAAGTVLRLSWQGSRVWVVWSGATPVAVYPATTGDPPTPVPVARVVQHADLGRRATPEQLREATRLRRAQREVRSRLGRRVSAPGPDAEQPPEPPALR